MPLWALCKLEFNCRVSSMGMEVSASCKQTITADCFYIIGVIRPFNDPKSICSVVLN